MPKPKLPLNSKITRQQFLDHDKARLAYEKGKKKLWKDYVPILDQKAPEGRSYYKSPAKRGERVKIYGITKGGYKNPSIWTINEPNSKRTNRGHSHYAYLRDPEFEIDRSGMFVTRGVKVPSSPDSLETGTRQPEKTPYAFVHGNIIRQGRLKNNINAKERQRRGKRKLNDVSPSMPNQRGAKYKTGGLSKVSAESLLSGKSDSFVGYGLLDGATRLTDIPNYGRADLRYGPKDLRQPPSPPKRLVGRKEFDNLSREEKRKVYLVSGMRMLPNGQMHYYSRNKKYTLF